MEPTNLYNKFTCLRFIYFCLKYKYLNIRLINQISKVFWLLGLKNFKIYKKYLQEYILHYRKSYKNYLNI